MAYVRGPHGIEVALWSGFARRTRCVPASPSACAYGQTDRRGRSRDHARPCRDSRHGPRRVGPVPGCQVGLRRCGPLTVEAPSEQLGQVDGLTPAAVEFVDLRAAAEAVREDDSARLGPSDRRQQHALGAGLADLEMAGFEAEVTGQTAAA